MYTKVSIVRQPSKEYYRLEHWVFNTQKYYIGTYYNERTLSSHVLPVIAESRKNGPQNVGKALPNELNRIIIMPEAFHGYVCC